jgi:hypothetical protein
MPLVCCSVVRLGCVCKHYRHQDLLELSQLLRSSLCTPLINFYHFLCYEIEMLKEKCWAPRYYSVSPTFL